VLILGDSIAESMGPGPSTPLTIRGHPVEVVNRAIIACPVMFEGRWVFDDGRLINDPPECEGDDRFDAFVADADPDVVLLWFGWPGTISSREFADGAVVAPCEPRFDGAFGDGLAAMADRYDDARIVVATVGEQVEYADPTQSVRPGCLNDAIRARDLAVFDFGAWLCPDGDCTVTAPLLRDVVHFKNDPAVHDQVWPIVLDQVLAEAGYP
jgi:hypothetical protein